MKIDSNHSTSDPIVTSQTKNQGSSASTNQTHSAGEDTASLSFDRASVSSLVTQAMASPEVRQAKVAALRQAISSGQFKIEPDKIAEAMLPEPPKA